MKLIITTLLTLLFCVHSLFSQIKNETTYHSRKLVPRLGVNVQRGYGVEAGFYLNQFYSRIPRNHQSSFIPYSSSGYFVASELNVGNPGNPIFGPKIGWEAGTIAETHGSFFGAEFIYYTNLADTSPAIQLKIGLPLLWTHVNYGFTMYFGPALKEDIGKHRLSLVYVFNPRAKKGYKKLKDQHENRSAVFVDLHALAR
jgi:hypothetical protein